jgi:hypothetical protein
MTPVFAQQINMGAVNGTVTDGTGAAIPGVKVTATSPALQGAEVFTTNEQGIYRFPSLPIGLYKIVFEAHGFGTVERVQVSVRLNFADVINITLVPATQQQTVVVTGETPLVDTLNTQIIGGFTQQQLQDVPNGRDMWSAIGLTPGMHDATLDVGGSQVGNQVAYTSYGYGGQNRVMVDGINDSEGASGAGFYFDYGAFQEFTVGTQGNDASMPVPGNQVNAVIKTGTNQFHGDMYFDYENPNFQGHNISQSQVLQGAGLGQRIHTYYDPDGDIGGPIIKDKLWFFASIRDQTVAASVLGFPVQAPGTVPSYSYDRNVTYKLNGNINPNQRLSTFAQWNPILKPQRASTAGDYEDAMYYQKAEAWVGNVQWSSVWSPKFFTNVLIGTWGYNFPQVPYGVFAGDPGTSTCPCAQTLPKLAIGSLAPRMTDLASGDLAGAYPEVRLDPRRYQIEPTGSYFLDNFLHTSHQIKFGYIYEREIENDQYYAGAGGVQEEIFDSVGLPDFSTPYEIQIANDPRIDVETITHHGAFITDQFKVGKRLTFNVGTRFDYYAMGYRSEAIRSDCTFCGYFYEGQTIAGSTIPVDTQLVNGAFPNKTVATFPHLFVPRIGVAWDVTGKGRTVLKMDWGQYYSYPSTVISDAVEPLLSASATFHWNDPTNAPFNISQLTGIAGQPTVAQGATVAPNLKDERMDDMGIVIQHQLTNTLSIEGGFILKELHNSPEVFNNALPASLFTLPVVKNVPATWSPTGTVTSTTPVTLYDVPANVLPSSSQDEIESPSNNIQVYRNWEFTINKRMSQRFTVVASYYWTHSTASTGGYACPGSTCSGINALPSSGVPSTAYAGSFGLALNPDQLINNHLSFNQWTAHIDGTYALPWWGIRITPTLRMQEGNPMYPVSAVTGLNVGTFYLPLAPYGSYYSPNLYVFDARFEKDFHIKERYRISAFADVYNIFNTNAANTEGSVIGTGSANTDPANTAAGSTVTYEKFGAPTLIIPPRIVKLGVRFSF